MVDRYISRPPRTHYVYAETLMWSRSQVAPVPVSCVPQNRHVAAPAVLGAPQEGQWVAPPSAADFGVVVPAGRTNVPNSVKVSDWELPSVATPVSASCVKQTPVDEKRAMIDCC